MTSFFCLLCTDLPFYFKVTSLRIGWTVVPNDQIDLHLFKPPPAFKKKSDQRIKAWRLPNLALEENLLPGSSQNVQAILPH